MGLPYQLLGGGGGTISGNRVCMACLWLGWHLIRMAGAVDCE